MSSKKPFLVHLWVCVHMCIGTYVCVGGTCYMEVRGWSKMSLSIAYFPRRGLSLYPVLNSTSLVNQFVLLTPCFCLPSASITVGYQANMAFYLGSGDSNPVLTHGAISWVFSPSFLQLPLRSFVTAARMQLRGCRRGMCSSTVPHCAVIPETVKLAGGKVSISCSFSGFKTWSTGLLLSRLWWGSPSMQKGHGGASCSPYGRQEVKKKRKHRHIPII